MSKNVLIGWLSDDVPDDVPAQVERAWQELAEDPAWREWLADHRAHLHDDVSLFLWVDDGDDVRAIFEGRLDYHVPVSMFFEPGRVPEVARALLRGIYVQRAKDAGVPPPPPVR